MIPGIVLAAGKSTRMGRTKTLLSVASDTLLSRIVATLREGGVEDVVVVVGADADAVRSDIQLRQLPVRIVENHDYELGQLSSLICGLATIDRPGVTAALVMLIDAPLVSSTTVRMLLDTYRTTQRLIVRPVSGGRHGHPVIFDRTLFTELRQADLQQGAKEVLRAHAADLLDVEIEDEGAYGDIDTPEDYQRIRIAD